MATPPEGLKRPEAGNFPARDRPTTDRRPGTPPREEPGSAPAVESEEPPPRLAVLDGEPGCWINARVHRPEEPRSQAEAIQAAPGLLSRSLRVAIIEDNRDSATSLTLLLELIGHQVRVAHAGPAGVELVCTWKPDAVISDLGLPGFDGFEVARRIRQEPGLRKVLLLALTGYGEDSFRRQSREAGFDYHLVKPADPLVLQRLLAERAAQLDARDEEGPGSRLS